MRNRTSILVVVATLALAARAEAQPTMIQGGVIRDAGETYTFQRETQSKVFFVDGSWWGVFGGTTGLDFYRFDAGTQKWSAITFPGSHISSDPSARADCHWDGANLVVLFSTNIGSGKGNLNVSVYSYTRPTFAPFSGYPVLAVPSQAVDKNWATAVDTNGRLWISYQTVSQYGVVSSTGTGPTGWGSFNPTIFMGDASTGADGDLGSHGIIAFGGKIGLMWTECKNAPDDHTKFRWRLDSNADLSAAAWGAVELCQEDAVNTMLTDDHVCVREFEGQVWAASKTFYASSDTGKPRFTLMRRDTSGNWTHWTIKTIGPGSADYSTRPIITIDATNRLVYCLWHNNGVQYNTTPIDNPGTFSSIQGAILEQSSCAWDTGGPRIPCDSNSGMMIVADRNCDGWTMFRLLSLGAPTTGPLATITVTPNPAAATTGGQVTFTATGRDASGNVVTFTPTWTATGGEITPAGVYTAGPTPGTYSVTASSGSISGSATVNVSPPPSITSVVVTPNPASTTTGGTVAFSAQAKDQNGNNMSATFTWATTGGTIDATGRYTAPVSSGSYDVSATSSGVTGHATVNVAQAQQPVLTSVVVTPNPASTAPSGTVAFSAQAKDQNGNNMSATFTWATTGGTIDATGHYTAPATTGSFDVSATSSGVTGHATVNVSSAPPPPQETIVDNDTAGFSVVSGAWNVHFTPLHYGPSNRTLDAGAGSCKWTAPLASGTYDVFAWWPSRASSTNAQPTYTIHATTGDQAVVVDQTVQTSWGVWNKLGTFTLDSTASVTITAGSGMSAAADAVRFVLTSGGGPPPPPVLTSVAVTPNPASVVTGGTQTFTAQGKDQNGQPMSASFTWSATGGSIDASGHYTAGPTPGTFSVTATSGNVTGSATVNVTQGGPPPQQVLTTIVVSPNPAATTPNGTVAFTAQGKDQNGQNMATTFMWGTSAGTIDSSGHYTAPNATGSFDVSASSQGITGHATVNVSAAQAEVIVDDSDPGWSVVSGTWQVHFNAYHYGTSDHVIADNTSGVCQWTPALASGTYDVYVWVPARSNPALASYKITTTAGDTSVGLDQQQSAVWGVWTKLGTFSLDASTAKIQLIANAGQSVAADATRFVKVGP